jgi:hypothetical protein
MASDVNTVPLSRRMVAGLPRRTMMASRSQATRRPLIEVPATRAKRSRAQSS